MRSFARMGLLLALSVTAGGVFAREQFSIPGARPASIREVDEAMRGDDEQTSIPAYLEGAMCGGWDKELGVGAYIADVRNLPGRYHDWAGDIPSGMGTRNDANGDGNPDNDFTFPDATRGLATVCEKDRGPTDWKPVWRPLDGGRPGEIFLDFREYAYPVFQDPPCQWRISEGQWPPIPLNEGEVFQYTDTGPNEEFEERATCMDFCNYLNSFVYDDCLEIGVGIEQIFDDDGNLIGENEYDVCDRWAWRYVCSESEVGQGDWDVACDFTHGELEEWANARPCVGQECRCPLDGPDACWFDERGVDYQSYYRVYGEAGYQRAPLDQHVPDDSAAKATPVSCFGFYNEFDPKTHQTQAEDRRCVINVDVQDMNESQRGKAEYKEKNVEDRDPTDPANQRPGGENDEPGVFDKDKDTWYKKLGTAFSFVNENLFGGSYGNDLGNVFLAYDELDDGEQRATPQINDDKLLAESNLMRAFDDTGNPRAYARWWQEQQTRMAALMRPPVLRIVLPSAWFMGLDPEDPFLTNVSGTEGPTGRADRADRIELQIEADEDTLGTAFAYLERSVLLHIEEEPIQVLVPMGSPVEFRARAADWCAWYKSENSKTDCDDAPQEVKDVMERLEQYAARIDQYRELRAETAETAGAVLDLQRRLLEPIAGWFRDNEQRLQDIVRGRQAVERDLLPVWNDAQAAIRRLHERTNLPWCMNQRFTSPTYSLLDDWLASRRRDGTPTNELGLPLLPLVERPEDVIIDFSAIAAMSGTLKIPVLKPIQVRIDIPAPPQPGELAELPSVEEIRAAMTDAMGELPEVRDELEDPPLMEPPPPLSAETLEQARIALIDARAIAETLEERYEKFWKSIGPLKPDQEQFDRQIEMKTEMKCFGFDRLPCEHVEMDLLERVQRIGSRPLVQLYDDFLSIGTPRTEPTNCLPEDDACHILNGERTDPGFRWEVKGSRANDAPIQDLKVRILELTQPPPLGNVDPKLLRPHEHDPAPLQTFPGIDLTP